MKFFIFITCILLIDAICASKEIDNRLLRCLGEYNDKFVNMKPVAEELCWLHTELYKNISTINEIEEELGKIDPEREIEIGNYRLDAQGNILHKKIPLSQSEVHISDVIDNTCEKMSDYVRATYKSNGQLTLLKLVSSSGAMNPEMSKVDIIQDSDLNKSLKYHCEGIVEEFEDSIISSFVQKEGNVKRQICTNITKLCEPEDFIYEDDEDSEEDEATNEHHEL